MNTRICVLEQMINFWVSSWFGHKKTIVYLAGWSWLVLNNNNNKMKFDITEF